MSSGRILAIDYGQARIGLAWSDRMQMLASPLKTVEVRGKPDVVAKRIAEEIEALGEPLAKVVVGLPLNMGGDEGAMATEVRAFIAALEELLDTEIQAWDERLTSKQVERDLASRSVSRKKRTKVVDQAAAMLILQSYLDASGGF